MMNFHNIRVSYGKKVVVDDLSFHVEPNKITGLIGKNGSGKSTLIACVNNQVNYSGTITIHNQKLRSLSNQDRAKEIAILPQFLPKVALTVEQLVALGRTPYIPLGKKMSKKDNELINEAIEIIGLQSKRTLPISSLSGGEKQKAYLAMVLAQDTKVIFLDEPTTYMDMISESDFLTIVSRLKTDHHKTIVIVMHDLTKAVDLTDNLLILDQGKKVYFGSTQQCIQQNIIETTFDVKSSVYYKEDQPCIVYYR